MKRALLVALLLAGALAVALLLLARRTTPALALAPEPIPAALSESEPNAVQLSYVELSVSPHRNEQPGATQVFGWITRGDDGRPVEGGTLHLRFEEYSLAEGRAAELHATQRVGSRTHMAQVQDDGGWFLDLPGKCWIQDVEFRPRPEVEGLTFSEHWAGVTAQEARNGVILSEAQHHERSKLVRTIVAIDRPLERDALEVTFAASPGIQARGLVFDARSGEPIPGAQVALRSVGAGALAAITGQDGGFELSGIDPDDLMPENGMVTFLVDAKGHAQSLRKVAWEPGQNCIPAFKVVLEPDSR
jgi:hypothetical protein